MNTMTDDQTSPLNKMAERSMPSTNKGIFAALDVGSSKTICLIGKPDPVKKGNIIILGYGHYESKGIRRGAIIDMASASQTIRKAVEQAERMARLTITNVMVNISAGMPTSHHIHVELPINNKEVSDRDLRQLLDISMAEFDEPDQVIIHAIPLKWSVDSHHKIYDPRGMYGKTLGVDVHLVTAAAGPLRNLVACLEKCHLGIKGVVISPYAAGLSVLVKDEHLLGATVIDMGASSTSIAVFNHGNMHFLDISSIGGIHVSNDIARGLMTHWDHAERIKSLYGSVLESPDDSEDFFECPSLTNEQEETPRMASRSLLNGVIRPRIEETLEIIRDKLISAGFNESSGRKVVLTGGACQLSGMREFATRILGKHVRIGIPQGFSNHEDILLKSDFAVVTGLLKHAIHQPSEAIFGLPDLYGKRPKKRYYQTKIGRFIEWIKENV